VAAGCDGGDSVQVFAASSVTDVLPAIAERYREQHPDVDFEFSFSGSQTLASQIEEGAPADVYISANGVQAQRLVSAGLAAQSMVIGENVLVVAVRDDAPWRTVEELAASRPRVAVGAADVPVGALTETALGLLAPAVAGPLRQGIVTHDPNVRVVLSRVELGEADAAFVYSTDLAASRDVRAIALPPQLPRNQYVAALVTNGNDSPNAVAAGFVAFLRSEQAERILSAAGFLVAGDAAR
jgi:molybdate transport system substrate-binding protein